MFAWFRVLRNRGVAAQAAMLGFGPLLLLVLMGPPIAYWGGTFALAAAVLAAILCWTGAAASLVIANRLRRPNQLLAALYLGMILRIGIPLGFGLTVHLLGGPLAQAGTLYYVLIFYPVTLLVETALKLPTDSQTKSRQASPNVMP
jgi:hypothetical protein